MFEETYNYVEFYVRKEKGSRITAQAFEFFGARSWTRTNDPLINSLGV